MRFLLIAIVALFVRASYAQSAPPSDALTFGDVTLSGSLRTRILGWDWFEAASGDNAYAYSGNILRVGLSRKGDARNWNAEFAVPMLFGLPSNAIGAGPQQGALGFGGNYSPRTTKARTR